MGNGIASSPYGESLAMTRKIFVGGGDIRLNVKAFALACAILWGLGVFAFT